MGNHESVIIIEIMSDISILATSTGNSFILALISAVLIFSGMQMYKPWLASSQLYTLLGGYLGSVLFVLSITAMGNLKSLLFGKSDQIKLFPESNYFYLPIKAYHYFFML